MTRVRFVRVVGVFALLVGAVACDSSSPASPGPTPGTTITLASLTVSSDDVDGGTAVQGTATLSAAAATGGTPVSLSSSSAAATVPATITVPAGATSATFSITTSEVSESTNVTILGSSGGANRSATLRVRASDDPGTDPENPSAPARIEARHDDLIGGRNSTGTVTLSQAAPSGGITLRFSSDDDALEVPAQVTIAAGAKSATFEIRTEPVATARTATITVTGDAPAARRTVAALALTLTLEIRLLPEGKHPPEAADDSYTAVEDTALNVAAAGVLSNDSDSDGDTLTATLVDTVQNGTLSLNEDGSFTYTPDADFEGTDTFTYRADDGDATSNLATVTLTVNAVNDAPTISDVADLTIDEDTPTIVPFTIGDVETDAASLTVSGSSSDPDAVPSLVFGGSGENRTVTITPALNVSGIVIITLEVSDGTLTATDTFELTIASVNDAPVIDDIPDQEINLDDSFLSPWTPYTISDIETSAGELTVSAEVLGVTGNVSGPGSIQVLFGGSGDNRLLRVRSYDSNTGTATVAITVSDGIDSTTTTFVVFVLFGGLLSSAVPRRRRRRD